MTNRRDDDRLTTVRLSGEPEPGFAIPQPPAIFAAGDRVVIRLKSKRSAGLVRRGKRIFTVHAVKQNLHGSLLVQLRVGGVWQLARNFKRLEV